MFRQLLGFELKLHSRQVGFWVTLVIMLALGILFSSVSEFSITDSGERMKVNGAIQIAYFTNIAGLASIFFGAVFVVSGFMRDMNYNMLELTHSTAVRTRDMVLSRTAGVFIITLTCFLALMLGVFVGPFAPWVDKEVIGPLHAAYYVQPILVFLVLNTLLITALFTAIAGFTRSRALVYVAAVTLFFLYTGSGLVLQDAPHWLVGLSDPFGARALAIEVEYWPAAERNTTLAPLFGLLGWNRLFWGSIAIGLSWFNFTRFQRGLKSRGGSHELENETVELSALDLRAASTHYGIASSLLVLWRRFRFEYVSSVRSVPFLILTAVSLLLFTLIMYAATVVDPNPTLPTSAKLSGLLFGASLIPLLIIMVFFSGEIVWRDRTGGMEEIVDSTPSGNWPLLLGKWLALLALVITPLLGGILIAMAMQIILNGVSIHPLTYLEMLVVSFMPRLTLMTILALFVQNFLPNRVAGMLTAGGVIIFFVFLINLIPFVHPLMEYGDLSPGGYSEINGFSNLIRFKWYGLYWGSLALFFTVCSAWLWRRGTESGLIDRLRHLRQKTSLPTLVLATLSLLVFAGSGAWIFKATNIDNEFRTRKAAEKRQVAWEKEFDSIRKQTLPKIRKVAVDMDLHPKTRSGTVSGSFIIENTTGQPLSELWMQVPAKKVSEMDRLTLSGAALVNDKKMQEIDAKWPNMALFRFDQPLAAGDTTTLTFAASQNPPTLANGSFIRHNGTFINSFVLLPRLGVGDRRLRNPDKRRKYGLPELEKRPDQKDMAARQVNFITQSADYVDFTAHFCTDAGQIPIAPGQMVHEEMSGDRTCRDYQSSRPILNFESFLSAAYAVQRDTWQNPNGPDIPLAIYYHPAHEYNVARMISAMKDALSTYTKDFDPYQFKQVRILEFPYANFAQSFAGTIPFSENIGFVMDPGNPDQPKKIDLATYVTMHEIGHQWFAHQIVPANVKGFNVLSEGLTENAAMIAYEAKYGPEKAKAVLDRRAIQSYLAGRVSDKAKEPPLRDAEGQQYLDYNKASWVFWGLRHYLGTDKVVAAMDMLLHDYGMKGPPYPTTLDVIADVRAQAPEQYQQLISDYWNHITFWDFKIEPNAQVEKLPDGKFKVTLTLKSDKLYASEKDGKETSVSKQKDGKLDEWVEIGFFDKQPKKSLGMGAKHEELIHVTQADTKLSFTLMHEPEFVMVDPKRLLIERNVEDNVQKLKDVTSTEK